MYEKLDRLRAEVERLKARIEDDKAKLKAAEIRLKEAENAQILADVGALSYSPEQLAQFLQLAASGQLDGLMNPAGNTSMQGMSERNMLPTESTDNEDDFGEREDLEDED